MLEKRLSLFTIRESEHALPNPESHLLSRSSTTSTQWGWGHLLSRLSTHLLLERCTGVVTGTWYHGNMKGVR